MDSKIVWIIAAVLLDGLAGLAGGVLPATFIHRNIASLLAFAAGTLVGVAFFDLLPHALHETGAPHQVMIACLVGFAGFYVIESFLGSHASGQSGHKHSTIGPMILIGDAVHNAADGIALAAAFSIDIKSGIATTLAVIVHELPQEIGDFTILVSHGYSRGRALFYLFLVQLAALVGALGALWGATIAEHAMPLLLSASAGGFIYIASADLLPELQRHKAGSRRSVQFFCFCAGLTIIAALEFIHSHH